MIYGSQNRFAVEAEVYLISKGYIFGHICLWANNQRIGSYGQNVVLQTPALFFRDFLGFHGQRNHWTLKPTFSVTVEAYSGV